MLSLYNFLTRKKENFRPLRGKSVGLYTCGPTVYDFAHIGNLRTYVFEDVLYRMLKALGYGVKRVMNLTDIDDKIIKRAEAERKDFKAIGREYAKYFFNDLKKLNILPADVYPRATAHIREIIDLVSVLLKKGYAYKADDGSVYFDISKFKDYGGLSLIEKRDLKTGARVAQDEYDKENARDFVLWKAKKDGEPFWLSPFGPGRPGWHIECSAMSMRYLGAHFDIHSGGVDLLFPHHENEIAQSEAATGKKFVNYWLEGGHLMVEGEKMSKSLHNIFTLKDLEERGFEPVDFRYLVLGAHYRAKLNFTWESLGAAREAVRNLAEEVARLSVQVDGGVKSAKGGEEREKEFLAAVSDDLNTPQALAVFWETLKDQNLSPSARRRLLLKFDEILGLGLDKMFAFSGKIPLVIKKLAAEREAVRRHQQFIKADALRKKIEALGYRVEDTPKGQIVFRNPNFKSQNSR